MIKFLLLILNILFVFIVVGILLAIIAVFINDKEE